MYRAREDSGLGLTDQLSCRAYDIGSSISMSSPLQYQNEDSDVKYDHPTRQFNDRSALRVATWKIDFVIIPLVGMFCALIYRAPRVSLVY